MLKGETMKNYDIVINGEKILGLQIEDGGGVITYDNFEYNDEIQDQLDTITSMILAHACEGIDVSSTQYVNGLKTTLDYLENL